MATNPMQRKSRISFLLGMVTMLVIAAIIIIFLYMQIRNQKAKLDEYVQSSSNVYVLKQDVKSGQVLTPSMFEQRVVSKMAVPNDASTDIYSMLENAKIIDTEGREINAPSGEKNYYYYRFSGQDRDVVIYTGDNVPATSLKAGDRAYYYAGSNNTQKTEIQIAQVTGVVAKINMKANTVITKSAIEASDERVTKDLRKTEYNVISLPVDLQPDEYVDIRLTLPTGENYIVVSKKQVTIPMSNGVYLADTIQMNLTEDEILLMSAAIVERFQIDGSSLQATRYIEAGNQEEATVTYYPGNEVMNLIAKDPNIVKRSISGIQSERQTIRDGINSALNKYGTEDNLKTKTEESEASTLEARKNYLNTLIGGGTQ